MQFEQRHLRREAGSDSFKKRDKMRETYTDVLAVEYEYSKVRIQIY